MVLDNDADAGALGACAELDLGALGEGGLGVGESAVEAGQISLADLLRLGPVDAGRDGLA